MCNEMSGVSIKQSRRTVTFVGKGCLRIWGIAVEYLFWSFAVCFVWFGLVRGFSKINRKDKEHFLNGSQEFKSD